MKSLIIADIHANLAALEAVLEHEQTWDEVIFLGDAVIGGPQPDEVLSLLSTLNGFFLMGNHDEEALSKAIDPDEQDPHKQWTAWTQQQISPANRRFLERFSPPCAIEIQELTFRLVHGVLPREWGRRIWPDSPDHVFAGIAAQFHEPYILIAHSHVQFQRLEPAAAIINPGSVGQPRLGYPHAFYAVLEDRILRFGAVPYDAEKTCEAMDVVPLDADFVRAWQECYRAGVLPSRYNLRDFGPLRELGYR